MPCPTRQPLVLLSLSMAKGQKMSLEVQQIILQLSTLLSHENIAIYTGLSLHTVEQVLHDFRKWGTIQDQEKEQCERPKKLQAEDMVVSTRTLSV